MTTRAAAPEDLAILKVLPGDLTTGDWIFVQDRLVVVTGVDIQRGVVHVHADGHVIDCAPGTPMGTLTREGVLA